MLVWLFQGSVWYGGLCGGVTSLLLVASFGLDVTWTTTLPESAVEGALLLELELLGAATLGLGTLLGRVVSIVTTTSLEESSPSLTRYTNVTVPM